MAVVVETSTGKSRVFRDVFDYLKYTENGFQTIISDNIGSFIDPARAEISDAEDLEIENLPDLPDVEWEPK